MINISNAQHLCLLWIGIFIHTVFKLFFSPVFCKKEKKVTKQSHPQFRDSHSITSRRLSIASWEIFIYFFHHIDALCCTWYGFQFHFTLCNLFLVIISPKYLKIQSFLLDSPLPQHIKVLSTHIGECRYLNEPGALDHCLQSTISVNWKVL